MTHPTTEEQLRRILADFTGDANNPAFSTTTGRDELGPAILIYDDEGVLINWLRTEPPVEPKPKRR